jgi:hypothetical protein
MITDKLPFAQRAGIITGLSALLWAEIVLIAAMIRSFS